MDEIPHQELNLWRLLSDAYTTVRSQLDRDLASFADLSLSEFEVLRILREAGGALRMSDLADRAHASRSGLTRRVDRLERRGLVRRTRVDGDRRGLEAELTPAGTVLHDDLTPRYLSSLKKSVLERLDPHEIQSVAGLLERIR